MSSLNISIPDSLYQNLQEITANDHISIEEFINTAIAEKLANVMTKSYFQERGNRGNRQQYDAILAKVPDVAPADYDQ
jgi:metal-responsive CopG/Arc/MetJ family transcriptional regulator